MKKSKAKRANLTKTLRPKINFFKFPSLEPNQINSQEINRLLRNQELDRASEKLRNQARSISTAVSLTAGFFETLNSEIYGQNGFILDINSKDKELNLQVQEAFFKWEGECCKYGIFDFEDYEEMILTALFRDGEAFIRLHKEDRLRLEIIDAEDIDTQLIDENKNIYFGIEYEKDGLRAKKYYKKLKNEKYEIIEASDILHIKKSKLFKQKRGISALSSAIFDTHSKDKLKKSELDRARLASEATGFLTRKSGGEVSFSDDDFDENGELKRQEITIPQRVQTGMMEYLDDDITPHFIDPHNPINMEYFLKAQTEI